MNIYIIEGIDGSGKSTAAKALKDFWEKEGKEVLSLREPAGYFRSILIGGVGEGDTSYLNEWMAFWMGRFEIWRHEILPRQDEDIVVIIDRSYASTYAYQIEGRKLTHFTSSFFFWKEQLLLQFKPGSTRIHHLYLRISVETGLSRVGLRGGGELTHFEIEDMQRRVKFGFDFYYAPKNARKNLSSIEVVYVIDGEVSREEVCDQVTKVLIHQKQDNA